MENYDDWIMAGWHGEQWNFQNNEDNGTFWSLDAWQDCMENSEIFNTMKRQWNIVTIVIYLCDY